jgi:Tfp pilus assembly protein PilX
MTWITDNLGYVILFVVVLLVVLAIIGMVTGKFPDVLDAIRGAMGV